MVAFALVVLTFSSGCQATTDPQSELLQLRNTLRSFLDREQIRGLVSDWRVLMDDASNYRGSDYSSSDTALAMENHYRESWTENATLTVTDQIGSTADITGRTVLQGLWDDNGSFRLFQSNQRTINGLHAVEIGDNFCTATARGSMNTFYDAYVTNDTVPGTPVIGMMTPFNMAYYFERPNVITKWRINHVDMIADFFLPLAPTGFNWNNCGRVEFPNLCDN